MTKQLNNKPATVENPDDAVTVAISELYTTAKKITQATDMAHKLGRNLQRELQVISCSIIQHLDQHKDTRYVKHFLDNMPASQRKQSMSKFFDKYAKVKFVEDEATGEMLIKFAPEKQTRLAEALIFPWWKATVEKPYVPFNLEAELAKLIQRAENKLARGVSQEKGDVINTEAVSIMAETLSRIHGMLHSEVSPESQAA